MWKELPAITLFLYFRLILLKYEIVLALLTSLQLIQDFYFLDLLFHTNSLLILNNTTFLTIS